MAPDKIAPHLRTGRLAEDRALDLLSTNGLRLVTRNYRCKLGEIDLIMQDGKTLVFVEVRFRYHQKHGSGAESITVAKRRRIINTARHYLKKQKQEPPPCRFDVVSSSGSDSDMHMDWIRAAFEL